eukprot:scaffold199163_cov46-Prasinocladus_malaysianus.AAC.1
MLRASTHVKQTWQRKAFSKSTSFGLDCKGVVRLLCLRLEDESSWTYWLGSDERTGSGRVGVWVKEVPGADCIKSECLLYQPSISAAAVVSEESDGTSERVRFATVSCNCTQKRFQ